MYDILLSYDNSIPNLFKQLYTYSKSNIYNNYIFYIAVIITVLKNSISTFNINDLIEQYRILKNKYHIQKTTYEHKNNQKLIIP